MTTRVFDLWRPPQMLLASHRRGVPEPRPGQPAHDLAAAAAIALVLVPVVGAAERPAGFLFAGVSAAVVLLVAIVCGSRLPWSWLTLIAAVLGFALPRDPWPAIGPAFFVATVLCGFLWLRQPVPNHRRTSRRPEPGSRERTAQVMLGLSGERQVGQFLADALPQDYALLNGLTLPAGAGDIDHLVIGPTGVFLLETKTMAGHIVCAPDGSWHRTRVGRAGTPYQAYIGNPAHQVERNIFAVRQTLRRRLPASLTSMLWIEGLVVFPHPRTELETRNSRVPAVLLDGTIQRICEHVPRWRLGPEEVDAVVAALLEEGKAGSNRALANRHSAQALVELAVLLPAVLTLAFATVGISRIVQTHSAVVAIAQQAARAGALASNPAEARVRMQTRAETVAGGLGLDARLLAVDEDLSQFTHSPGTVEVRVSYPVTLSDLPVIGELVAPVVSADHVEWVDPFRSGVQLVPAGTR